MVIAFSFSNYYLFKSFSIKSQTQKENIDLKHLKNFIERNL